MKTLVMCTGAQQFYIESFSNSILLYKFLLLCIWCAVWSMEDGQYAAIYYYTQNTGLTQLYQFTKYQKFVLRRSYKNYKLVKGKLYYKEHIQDGTDRDRLVKEVKQTDAW